MSVVLLGIAAAVGAGALLLRGSAKASSSSGSSSGALPDLVVTGDAAALDAILVEAGLSPAWRRFCLLTAAGESGFTSNVYLGLPENQPPGTVLSGAWESIGESEYKATIVAYNRHADRWGKCPWPKMRYTTAGGLFGFLAPNAIYGYMGTELECLDPWSIYDAVEAVPMFLAICKRIMGNSRFTGDWLDLRCGVGALERMGNKAARDKMAKKLADQGILNRLKIPPAWLYEKAEKLGSFDIVALRTKLLAKFRPGGGGAVSSEPVQKQTWRELMIGYRSTGELMTGGASFDDDVPVVVALHGRGDTPGAMEQFLRNTPEPVRYIIPKGFRILDDGSFAWWKPSIKTASADELAAAMGEPADELVEMLLAIEKKYGRRPALLGYSQGAMLALLIASRAGHLVPLVVSVAGMLPPSLYPEAPDGQSVSWPVVVGVHGANDSMVPIELAVDTFDAFEAAGADLDFLEIDNAGHDFADLWPAARGAIMGWA